MTFGWSWRGRCNRGRREVAANNVLTKHVDVFVDGKGILEQLCQVLSILDREVFLAKRMRHLLPIGRRFLSKSVRDVEWLAVMPVMKSVQRIQYRTF